MASARLDYAAVGMGMFDIRRTLLDSFLEGPLLGIAPPSLFIWGKPGCVRRIAAGGYLIKSGRLYGFFWPTNAPQIGSA